MRTAFDDLTNDDDDDLMTIFAARASLLLCLALPCKIFYTYWKTDIFFLKTKSQLYVIILFKKCKIFNKKIFEESVKLLVWRFCEGCESHKTFFFRTIKNFGFYIVLNDK